MGGVLKKLSKSVMASSSVATSTLQLYSPDQIGADFEWRKRTYGNCVKCGHSRTDYSWCQKCESDCFEAQFPHWTSGSMIIDDFIRQSQKSAVSAQDYLEWIPYEKFREVEYLTCGGYGDVYTARWAEGPRWAWNGEKQERCRTGARRVALKSLKNSQEITADFLNELALYRGCSSNGHVIFCYGISQDPSSKNYLLVMDYALGFHEHMIMTSPSITWKKKLEILYDLANSLVSLHSKKIVHRNLHPGNVFIDVMHPGFTYISDIGQFFPPHKSLDSEEIYGVLPYVPPEIILGHNYTTASDVYSFAMIMWGISTGKRPFSERPHDQSLASDICANIRPKVAKGTPPCYVKLMKRCWDSSPHRRPDVTVVADILGDWLDQIQHFGEYSNIKEEFEVADETMLNDGSVPKIPEIFHPLAVYNSRLLEFSALKVL